MAVLLKPSTARRMLSAIDWAERDRARTKGKRGDSSRTIAMPGSFFARITGATLVVTDQQWKYQWTRVSVDSATPGSFVDFSPTITDADVAVAWNIVEQVAGGLNFAPIPSGRIVLMTLVGPSANRFPVFESIELATTACPPPTIASPFVGGTENFLLVDMNGEIVFDTNGDIIADVRLAASTGATAADEVNKVTSDSSSRIIADDAGDTINELSTTTPLDAWVNTWITDASGAELTDILGNIITT